MENVVSLCIACDQKDFCGQWTGKGGNRAHAHNFIKDGAIDSDAEEDGEYCQDRLDELDVLFDKFMSWYEPVSAWRASDGISAHNLRCSCRVSDGISWFSIPRHFRPAHNLRCSNYYLAASIFRTNVFLEKTFSICIDFPNKRFFY